KYVLDKIDILNFLFLKGKPSQIYWSIIALCTEKREFEIVYQNSDTTSFETYVELINTPQLLATPPFLRFSSVIPNQFRDLDLFLVAKNFDIRIDSFKLTDPHFKIINGAITNPFVLQKDSAYKLTIRFTPTDSSVVFDSLVIYSNACHIRKVNITGGFPNKKPKDRTLSVLSPEPNEKYFLGDTIKIRWDGVLPTDVVQLQYSTNGGQTWDTLAINVLGLEYKFYLDPQRFKTSDSCLIRVIQIWPNNAGETIELRHQNSINSANFNRDASLIVTSTNQPDDFVSIWNPGIGAKTFALKGHTKQVNWACFDFQDRYLITASDDSTSILYDVKTGDSLYTFSAHRSKVTSANFSPDGNYLLTT
ncbi:MAG: WD40 repeat domain-containing protein, partial [Candidatus Kapaibacteriota bacterium]